MPRPTSRRAATTTTFPSPEARRKADTAGAGRTGSLIEDRAGRAARGPGSRAREHLPRHRRRPRGVPAQEKLSRRRRRQRPARPGAHTIPSRRHSRKSICRLCSTAHAADSPLANRDEVFALLLEIAETSRRFPRWPKVPLLDDDQFDRLIARILASPGCGNEAVAIISKASRLTSEQRLALRAKALGEAALRHCWRTPCRCAFPIRTSAARRAHANGFHGRPGRRGARAGGARGAIAGRHPARCRDEDRQGEDLACAGRAAARQFLDSAATRSMSKVG